MMGSGAGRVADKQRERRKSGRKANRPARNTLKLDTWLAYLASLTVIEPDGKRFINGTELSDTQSRALHRWQAEECNPTLWGAENFLTAFYLILDDFFVWAELEKLDAWNNGPPDWWDAD